MKEYVRDLWIAALRSGEYAQAHGTFVDTTRGDPGTSEAKYCCLAVLTDVAIKQGVEGVRWGPRSPQYFETISEDRENVPARVLAEGGEWVDYVDGDLPLPVRLWAGIYNSNPVLDGVEAVERNDSHMDDFYTISMAIEATS